MRGQRDVPAENIVQFMYQSNDSASTQFWIASVETVAMETEFQTTERTGPQSETDFVGKLWQDGEYWSLLL
jgi:hypothetical protein